MFSLPLFRLFPLFCILFAGCGKGGDFVPEEEKTEVRANENLLSAEQEIENIRAELASTPSDCTQVRLEIRLRLAEQLQKARQTDAANSQTDTIFSFLEATGDQHSRLYVRAQNLRAGEDFRQNRLEAALDRYLQAGAANQALAVIDSAEWLKSRVNAGVILDRLRRYDEALENYRKAIPVAEADSPPGSDRLAKIYNNTGNTLNHLQRPQEAVGYFQKAALFLRANFPEDYPYTAKTRLYLGDALLLLGRTGEAEEQYESALEIYNRGETDPASMAEVYLRTGNTLKEKGDLEKAIDYYRQSVQLYARAPVSPYIRDASAGIYHNLALAYLESRDFQEAHENMTKAEAIYNELYPGNFGLQGQLALNRGLIFFNEKKRDEARKAFELARQNYIRAYDPQSPWMIYVLYALGSVYEEEKSWEKAAETYNDALKIALENYGPHHFSTARTYMNMATLAKKQRLFDQAEKTIDLAIQCLYPGYSSSAPITNTDTLPRLSSAGSLIKILWTKAEILRDRGETTRDTTALSAGFYTFDLTLRLIATIRQQLSPGQSRQLLTENNYQLYDAGISTAWKLFEWTNDTTWLEKAFDLSERSKAQSLFEAVKESRAKIFAGIPDLVIEREQEIQDQRNLIEKKLFDASEGKISPKNEEIAQWENMRFSLQLEYDSLRKTLQIQYPQYFRLRYDRYSPGIEEIRQWLPDSTSMISCFTGDSSCYIFALTKEKFSVRKIEQADLGRQVANIRSGVLDWHYDTGRGEDEKTKMLNAYARAASALYDELLGETEAFLQPRIVIIPDGALGYLPFELLLTANPDTTQSPSAWPFMVKKHAISYNYSASLYLENKLKERENTVSPGKGLVAFAPAFEGREASAARKSMPDSAFAPLIYNMEEATTIAQITGGKAVTGKKATVDAFYDLAPSKSVIHLSSHGKVNDRDARFSYIAFADPGDSLSKQLLYVADLYSLRLNADLVVLSACETGLGKLYRGEGIASLARAFTYAGARSITTTLWRVNDRVSATLMSRYYEFMEEGLPKDIALQRAKLETLKTQSDPFLWAGFVSIGDMDAIKLSVFPWRVIWIIAGILLTGVGIVVYFAHENYSSNHRSPSHTGTSF
ncbi:MAG: CHAT domain-containing tetratricopeptide repeat protein [Bacteroidia bacterium]